MSIRNLIDRFRTRTDPDRAERAARDQGKSEADVARARKQAGRRRKLLRSGGAGGGSVGG
jgi:anti-sigma regulatory factor (Ser/Thr protein kinase)